MEKAQEVNALPAAEVAKLNDPYFRMVADILDQMNIPFEVIKQGKDRRISFSLNGAKVLFYHTCGGKLVTIDATGGKKPEDVLSELQELFGTAIKFKQDEQSQESNDYRAWINFQSDEKIESLLNAISTVSHLRSTLSYFFKNLDVKRG